MIEVTPINVTSIKVVHNELGLSIEKASRHFEAFAVDTSAQDQLRESLTSLAEIVGVFKMLGLKRALELSEGMVLLSNAILDAQVKASDFALSALSHAYVGLPCYIEYVKDREQAIPALLDPFVNEIKAALRQPIRLESELAGFTVDSISLGAQGASEEADLAGLYGRMRQLYQLGLIGLIREENLEFKLQLMHRAVSRLAKAVGAGEGRTQWRLTEAVLEGLMSGDLSLSFTRKRVLSRVDALIRQALESNDLSSASDDAALMAELVYLIEISSCSHSAAQEVHDKLGLDYLAFDDRALQRERSVMQGPNAETIIVMVDALKEELAQAKQVLEIAAQDPESSDADMTSLAGLFQRTSDILAVVGVQTPSQILAGLLEKVKSWADGNPFDREGLLDVADGLLYVESMLSGLSRLDLNFEDTQQDDEARKALMAQSQLDEAQKIVVSEAQAGIGEAKKDITSFIESDFNTEYVQSVLDTLVSVRGAMDLLGLKRASSILTECAEFVAAQKDADFASESGQEILEVIADALIALEYYLSEIELYGEAPVNVLDVAEQSLKGLERAG
ncbi:Uncharacterised protein [BD1-7 clade bacterium]|uniref:Scaffold protein FimL second domain-containing protein n=1 Tax=BD1-7 clade bacterium TaxID=2029982 RepID=A0A5S9QTP5_9GAMM|nr:Uncharacterised protein [BD1-7 clade bacterium]CAA0122452.1 Uncharacterised protein [BD1-7 clade bacterium]